MPDIPDALQAQLSSGVTCLAWVWLLTRRDGRRFGFTDHDQPLTVHGVRCEPENGFESGDLRTEAGASPAQGVVYGAFNSPAITEGDLNAGLWDGARVHVYRVDWRDPDLNYRAFTGELGAMRSGPDGFEAEVSGLSARLNRTLGRVFSRRCDAELGDARCGVDLSARQSSNTLASVLSPTVLLLDGRVSDPQLYEHGVLSWPQRSAVMTSRIVSARVSSDGLIVELDQALRLKPDPQEPVLLQEGCDKRFETCRVRFENALNFRGCPHMPGNDALLRVAREGAIRPADR